MLSVNRFLTPIRTPPITHLIEDDIQDDERDEAENSAGLMLSKSKAVAKSNAGSLFKNKRGPKLQFTSGVSEVTDKHPLASFGSFMSITEDPIISTLAHDGDDLAKDSPLPVIEAPQNGYVPSVNVQLPETDLLLPIDLLKRVESPQENSVQRQTTENEEKTQDMKQQRSPVEPTTPEIHVLGFDDFGAPLKRCAPFTIVSQLILTFLNIDAHSRNPPRLLFLLMCCLKISCFNKAGALAKAYNIL
jgi:hypothetical protein